MSDYVIVVTPNHDAVDYSKYNSKATECDFDFRIQRIDPSEKTRRAMVLIPRDTTTALDLHDMTRWLDFNAPLLTTYVICS